MGKDEKRSIIKDKHIAELETWVSTQEAARRLDTSRPGVIRLAGDRYSPVRGVHVGKHRKGERGVWLFDPLSIERAVNERLGAEERVRAEAERKKREETQRRIDRAEGRG